MARVLFVNPLIREEDSPRHVPYGMALLAAIVMKEGHLVQIYDANAWRLEDDVLRRVLEADDWDVVAVGGITTAYGSIKQIVKAAKQYAPQALVVAGGGFLTSMPRDIMTFLPEIDIGIVGEAYCTFPQFLQDLDRKAPEWNQRKGLIWRAPDGRIVLNDEQRLLTMTELDELPWPAWELFPLNIYFRNSSVLHSQEGMQARRRLDINASYGCSLVCRFCFHLGLTGELRNADALDGNGKDAVFTWDRNIRWHSPQYIVNLVKYAHERFGVDFISFLDENLMTMNTSTQRKWIPDICDLWIKEGLQPRCVREGRPHDPDTCDGVHWGGTSHATLAYPEVLKKMHEAGCTYLDYGLESFSDRVLKTIGKGATAKTNERGVRITLEAGIRPVTNQIIGFPDEFFDSIRESVIAWERLGIQVIPFFATAYPGSEWYYKYKARILKQYDGDLEAYVLDLGDATKITSVICENFNAVELLGLRELMIRRDIKRINEYESIWRSLHGEPTFSHDPLVRPSAHDLIMLSSV